jgi:hypothetical protein
MKRHFALFLLFLLPSLKVLAQQSQDSTSKASRPLTVEGYIDAYFSFDFNEPENSIRPYSVSYTRHNEFNINLAYVSLKYASENVKAVFTPGFGTYMNANYATERVTLKNIVEAYVSVKLFRNKNIWLDAGVIPSPYTNETAIALDQICYSRSFAPEYTPYYLTGAKLSLPLSEKVIFYTYLLNGWQVIEDVNSPLALGTQLDFKPNANFSFTWNTYLGNEKSVYVPDYKMRYFTDSYFTWNKGDRWTFTGCAYAGLQEKRNIQNETTSYGWYQGNIATRYKLNKKNSISARVEYYSDYNQIMITPVTYASGFDTYSACLGYNLYIAEQVMFRLEAKHLFSNQDVFEKSNSSVNNNTVLLAGINARFK